MRRFLSLVWTLAAALGFAAPAGAADRPKLELADEKLPLVELRPLDRRVYLLTLEGKWLRPSTPGKGYYINLLFPNGQSYNHRPLDDELFRAGEVRAVLQDYQLKRAGVADGGRLSVVVSEGKPVASAGAPEVVSNVLEVAWPMDRAIVQKPPRSRYSPPPSVDPFPPGPDELPPRGPGLRPKEPGLLPPPKVEEPPPAPPRPEAELVPPPKPADE